VLVGGGHGQRPTDFPLESQEERSELGVYLGDMSLSKLKPILSKMNNIW
jgi:hypothetical protein